MMRNSGVGPGLNPVVFLTVTIVIEFFLLTTTLFYRQVAQVYQEQLRTDLEHDYLNSFVAIEPVSGDDFLGATLSEASVAACVAHLDRRCCVMRMGHDVTVQIGAK